MAAEGNVRNTLKRLSQGADRNVIWIGVLILVLVVCFQSGAKAAVVFLAASVLGYLNAFKVVRPLVAALFMNSGAYPKVVPTIFCALGSSFLIWLGYWHSLAIITSSLVVIDAIVLRFGR